MKGGSPSAESIRARLLSIARRERRDFNLILNLYYQERLLARLAASRYRESFLLKGGLLLFAIAAPRHHLLGRPTKDIDLLAGGMGNDPLSLRDLFGEICRVALVDGVSYDPDGISAERITEDADYQGVRLRIPASLASARGYVRVDIGFGDVVTPGPQEMTLPPLLEAFSGPSLLAYSVESVVAEKYEAMIALSFLNSRMKDFFDLYSLATGRSFDGVVLHRAILNTFEHRGTAFPVMPAIFQPAFASDQTRMRRWSAFLHQVRLEGFAPSFGDVMTVLQSFFQPLHAACVEMRPFSGRWIPSELTWS